MTRHVHVIGWNKQNTSGQVSWGCEWTHTERNKENYCKLLTNHSGVGSNFQLGGPCTSARGGSTGRSDSLG